MTPPHKHSNLAVNLFVGLLLSGIVVLAGYHIWSNIQWTDSYVLVGSSHGPRMGRASPTTLAVDPADLSPADQVPLVVIPGAKPSAIPTRVDPENSGPSVISLSSTVSAVQQIAVPTSYSSAQTTDLPPSHVPVDSRITLQAIPTEMKEFQKSLPPPLEASRNRDERERLSETESTPITIETGFECSPRLKVRALSPTHFAIELPSPYWFMFKVRAARAQIVRFDLINSDPGLANWSTLNPVYTYEKNLNVPATYDTNSCDKAKKLTSPDEQAWNGPLLPDSAKERWHFVGNAWSELSNQYSFVMKFEQDEATVAMRVPYTPTYESAWIDSLSTGPALTKHIIGYSSNGRKLQLLEIGEGDAGKKPCVLVYGGEHADEPDGMWAAHWITENLLESTEWAKMARDAVTFLVIPALDPDAAAVPVHERTICSFTVDRRTPETIAYANWFRNWVTQGKRLDIIFDLHNSQSAEIPSLACAVIEHAGARGEAASRLFAMLCSKASDAGLSASKLKPTSGWCPDRLGGWLSGAYGSTTLHIELNVQERRKHLGMLQLRTLANCIPATAVEFISDPSAVSLFVDIAARREARDRRCKAYGKLIPPDTDAIAFEDMIGSGQHARNSDELLMNTAIP